MAEEQTSVCSVCYALEATALIMLSWLTLPLWLLFTWVLWLSLIFILKFIVCGILVLLCYAWYNQGYNETFFESLGNILRTIPYIDRRYKADIRKEYEKFVILTKAKWKEIGTPYTSIPDKGMSCYDILVLIDRYSEIVYSKVKDKHFSGTIYSDSLNDRHKSSVSNVYANDDFKLEIIYEEAYRQAYLWNSLHDNEFGIGSFIEYQVVQMVANMFGIIDKSDVRGFVTSGGTESLMLAMRCYRNYGMKIKRHQPGQSIILSSRSVHAAVLKAGEAYLMKVVYVDDDKEGRMDTYDLDNKLYEYGSKVVCVVGSVPSYARGVIDPIEDIARLADEYEVGFHIDCCLGGFIINNLRKNAAKYLALQGVTSLSADTHKNGLAPKGSSVLVTKPIQNINLAYYSPYVFPDWSGGFYATIKDSGSQSVVPAFTALLAMLATGKDGYKEMADEIFHNAFTMGEVVNKAFYDNFALVAKPEVNVVAFKINPIWMIPRNAIYAISHEMSKRGFVFNNMKDDFIHFCITLRFVSDLYAMDKFRIALSQSIYEVERMYEKGIEFPGDGGIYCALETAVEPKLAKLTWMTYIENKLLGRSGAKDAMRAYCLALMNPYA